MTQESVKKRGRRSWLWLVVWCLALAALSLWFTGVLRPPRPLFHSKYATPLNSERLPHWVADAPVMDLAGNLCYFDVPANLVLLVLASEHSVDLWISDPIAQGEVRLRLPHVNVSVPADPRDLLIIVRDNKVIAKVRLQQGDATVVKAWWGRNESRPNAIRALMDDNRIPPSIRRALDELEN